MIEINMKILTIEISIFLRLWNAIIDTLTSGSHAPCNCLTWKLSRSDEIIAIIAPNDFIVKASHLGNVHSFIEIKFECWTYVIFVDLDTDVEHLTVGVRVGVIAADHFPAARERRLRHVIVVIVGRPAGFTHCSRYHQQHRYTCRKSFA